MADGTNQVIPDEIRAPFVNEQRKLIEPWASWLRRTWQQAKAAITGSGTAGSLAVFTDTTVIGNGNLSGDASTSGGTVVTLAASGVAAGTYGDATHVSQVTVDAKGRVTTAADVAISASVSPPGGANTDIQYNDSGVFGGDANLTWDKTSRQARAIGLLASPVRASVGTSGGGEIALSPFSAAGNDITLGAYADASQNWIPSGTDLLDLFQRSSAHQDGGFEVAYGLTAGVPDPFTAAVGVHIVTPTDTSGDPINALEVYQYGGLGTGAKPGLLIIANRNDSGAGAASTLGGEQRGGTRWFIWQDATGAMRYGPARPTEDNSVSDTSGVTFGNVSAGATLTNNELVLGAGSETIKTVAATDGQIPIGKSSDGSVTLATLTAGANITITNAGGSITIAASGGSTTGGSTLIGLERILGDGSTTTFNLPDLAEYVVDVSDAGSTVDPSLYTLSSDLSQITFGTAPTAGHVLTFEYVVAQLAA